MDDVSQAEMGELGNIYIAGLKEQPVHPPNLGFENFEIETKPCIGLRASKWVALNNHTNLRRITTQTEYNLAAAQRRIPGAPRVNPGVFKK